MLLGHSPYIRNMHWNSLLYTARRSPWELDHWMVHA